MTGFCHKTILSESHLGAWLKQARTAKGWALEVLEEKTGVGLSYWQALENGQYHCLPGKIYAVGFIKQYAELVGLDVAKAQAWLESDYQEKTILSPETQASPLHRRWNFSVRPKMIRNLAAGAVLVGVLLYFGLNFAHSTSSPNLQVVYPASDMITQEREIEIVGQAAKESQVKINNQAVTCDADGKFTEKFILQEGLNTIQVVASRKHSKETSVIRKIIMDNSGQISWQNPETDTVPKL